MYPFSTQTLWRSWTPKFCNILSFLEGNLQQHGGTGRMEPLAWRKRTVNGTHPADVSSPRLDYIINLDLNISVKKHLKLNFSFNFCKYKQNQNVYFAFACIFLLFFFKYVFKFLPCILHPCFKTAFVLSPLH